MGIPVTFVPTVLLPWHPGHGPGTRIAVDRGLIDDVAGALVPGGAAGCLTGYFGTWRAGRCRHRAGGAPARRVSPSAPVLCDPVVGDGGRFYVGEAVRDRVRALAATADMLTPNRFELAFLAGRDPAALGDNAALAEAARSLGRPEVVVTSAFAGAGETANLLVTPERTDLVVHRAFDHAPHGTGDLLAALYFGHRLEGDDPARSADPRLGHDRPPGRARGRGRGTAARRRAGRVPRPADRRPDGRRLMATADPAWVAGVDGCPAGWAVVLRRADGGAGAGVRAAS